MSPDDKVKLINFFKKDPQSVVAMCGDGANDCGALLSADIGISLNDNDNTKKITSHFSFKNDSISCINFILRNGRACFESNIMILKFIVLYASLQLTAVLLLFTLNQDFTDIQYLYQDFLISLLLCIFAAK
jgi:cation-transporting ATPase 13A2